MRISTKTTAAIPQPKSPPPPNPRPEPANTAGDFNQWIECPLTGELVNPDDVDGLAAMYRRLDEQSKRIYGVLCGIRRTLADMTEGDAVSRRIRGRRCQVKVTMPAIKFEQSVLKALWESHPDLAHEFMRISQIDVKLREYSKLEKTASTDPQFVYFRDTLTNACRGRDGLPAIAIEATK